MKESLRLESVAKLAKDRDDTRSSLRLLEKKLSDIVKEHHVVISTNTSLKGGLSSVKAQCEELSLNNTTLLKYQDYNLKKSARSGRKEVRVCSRTLLQQVSEYVKILEEKLLLHSDVNELKSNEALIGQLEKGDTSFEKEKKK